MKESEVTLEGVVETGAQEHLYLEPCSTLVVPKKEDKEMEVFTGTQDATGTQVVQYQLIKVIAISLIRPDKFDVATLYDVEFVGADQRTNFHEIEMIKIISLISWLQIYDF